MISNVDRFLKRKTVIKVLGEKYELSSKQHTRLIIVFEKYGSPKKIEGWLFTLSKMVKYDLTNYVGRISRLMSLPAGPSKYAYVLRYGREFESYYFPTCEKKKNLSVIYWTNRGESEESARNIISGIQRGRAAKAAKVLKGTSEYSARSTIYWRNKGLSVEDSHEQVRRVQSRNHSIERNRQWQETLKSKSSEDIALMNLKKGHSIESHIARGYSEEEAIKSSVEYYKKRNNYSNISQVMFKMIGDHIGAGCYFKTLNYERQFFGKCVDFYYAPSKTVIEFYGDYWHCHPATYTRDFIRYGIPAHQIWVDDRIRLNKIAEHKDVSRIGIVWESEFKTNPTIVCRDIYEYLKESV